MKKFACLFALLALFQIANVQAQSVLDFKLVNRTGEILWGMYVSSSNDLDWGNDIIPKDFLENGASVNVRFNASSDAECEWDIKLTRDILGEDFVTIDGVDLCSLFTLTIYKNDEGEYYYKVD
ncbi:MAG: hypothetical protein HC913_16015 [Microscillaceae bacterium]|nr:hypothetical protein [Microscillaceae bacterium]